MLISLLLKRRNIKNVWFQKLNELHESMETWDFPRKYSKTTLVEVHLSADMKIRGYHVLLVEFRRIGPLREVHLRRSSNI